MGICSRFNSGSSSLESEQFSLNSGNVPHSLANYLSNPLSFRWRRNSERKKLPYCSHAESVPSADKIETTNLSVEFSHTLSPQRLAVNEESEAVPDCKEMTRQEFLHFQKSLILLEHRAELERNRCQTGNSEDQGIPGVLPNLLFMQVSSPQWAKSCVTFTSDTGDELPSGKLRKGDRVSIYCGGPECHDEDYCLDGVILAVDAQEVHVNIVESFYFDKDSSYSLQYLPSQVTVRRLLCGLKMMRDVSGVACRLSSILFGESEPMPPLSALPESLCAVNSGELHFYNSKLNDCQKSAVEFILKQQDIGVLHGPPGTGKTTVLVEVIRQHVTMGIKVLAMAPSNLGVDNLVERLHDVGLRVIRLGHPERVAKASQRHTLDALLQSSDYKTFPEDLSSKISEIDSNESEDERTKDLIRSADVVLCTLLSAHSSGFLRYTKDDHFGLAVIDECPQGMEASCYSGILRAPKLIMAGDHKQLPPTVLCPEASPLLTSLMERVIDLYGERVTRILTTQYRMNASIMNWSSDAMYGGQLVADTSVKGHVLCDMKHVTRDEKTKTPLLLVDTSDCPGYEESYGSGSKSNDGEASLVLVLVKKFLSLGIKQNEVAVITPYRRQVKLVQSLVTSEYPGVVVQTVDGFQGNEKEAVILTLVRSNDRGEIGFLSQDRRLNVAVTRARRHLSVICNTKTLQQNDFLKNFVGYLTENAKVERAEELEQESCVSPSPYLSQSDFPAQIQEVTKHRMPSSPKSEEEFFDKPNQNSAKREHLAVEDSTFNRHCTLCAKSVRSTTYITHRIACENHRAFAEQPYKLDSKKREADLQIAPAKSKRSRVA